MKLTARQIGTDWRVNETVEVVTVANTGPYDEPWHIVLGEYPEDVCIGQEATKRRALEVVAEEVEAGRLTRRTS